MAKRSAHAVATDRNPHEQPAGTGRILEEFLAAVGAIHASGRSSSSIGLLGETTCDVFLNGVTYRRNVPRNVWDYHIGGYQVVKKWLSYREDKILGRALRPEEVREVTSTARRIAAILLLQPALDANYLAVKAATYPFGPNCTT